MERTTGMIRTVTGREKGVSGVAVAAILILTVGVAGFAAFYTSSLTSGSSSCATVNIQASTSASGSGIHVAIYDGAANPSNAPGYRPHDITLVIGINNTVTWANDDSAAHTVTSTSAPSCAGFDSGNMSSGAIYAHTFGVPGTYQYDCKYHNWMTATIVVKAGA